MTIAASATHLFYVHAEAGADVDAGNAMERALLGATNGWSRVFGFTSDEAAIVTRVSNAILSVY
jgi:hypothetical protein